MTRPAPALEQALAIQERVYGPAHPFRIFPSGVFCHS